MLNSVSKCIKKCFYDGNEWKVRGLYRAFSSSAMSAQLVGLLCKTLTYREMQAASPAYPSCAWGDSNPHVVKHQILSLARLPLRHMRLIRMQRYDFFMNSRVWSLQIHPSSSETRGNERDIVGIALFFHFCKRDKTQRGAVYTIAKTSSFTRSVGKYMA